MQFNSPVSFFDKSKWLLFTSRDLRETNGVRFYNDQAELCMVWYILSIKDGVTWWYTPKNTYRDSIQMNFSL